MLDLQRVWYEADITWFWDGISDQEQIARLDNYCEASRRAVTVQEQLHFPGFDLPPTTRIQQFSDSKLVERQLLSEELQ